MSLTPRALRCALRVSVQQFQAAKVRQDYRACDRWLKEARRINRVLSRAEAKTLPRTGIAKPGEPTHTEPPGV